MRITVEVRAVDGGYRIDRSVAFDGETEGQLSEMYSLLDKQETERRERIWTKGEHGYFTGSISTGGSSGSGGGQKRVDKSAGSGIMESTEGVEELFDRKVSKTDFSEDLKKVNPNWNTGEPEWRNNCQRCVPAYEMRRRGFEVTAKPRDYYIQNGKKVLKDDPIANDCFSVWERVFAVSFKTKEDIEKRMNEWGDGARAQIRVTFKDGTGHTFVAERIAGKVHFVDPQTGSVDCSGYFDIILNSRNNRFARIDKATLKESCIEICCERERR